MHTATRIAIAQSLINLLQHAGNVVIPVRGLKAFRFSGRLIVICKRHAGMGHPICFAKSGAAHACHAMS